jgi:hypothetical protein
MGPQYTCSGPTRWRGLAAASSRPPARSARPLGRPEGDSQRAGILQKSISCASAPHSTSPAMRRQPQNRCVLMYALGTLRSIAGHRLGRRPSPPSPASSRRAARWRELRARVCRVRAVAFRAAMGATGMSEKTRQEASATPCGLAGRSCQPQLDLGLCAQCGGETDPRVVVRLTNYTGRYGRPRARLFNHASSARLGGLGHEEGPRLPCLALLVRRYLKMKFARLTVPSFSFITNCLQPLHELLAA